MELLTRIDNGFRFDASFAFLKGVLEFWILICPNGIQLNKKSDKDSKRTQRHIQNPVKHFK